jgi:hypothetical protein
MAMKIYVDRMKKDILKYKAFFIVKYWIVLNIQNLIVLSTLYLIGPMNFLQLIALLATIFFISFFVVRYFDSKINALAFKAYVKVSRSPRLKRLVARYL